jgi:hypothetical protein
VGKTFFALIATFMFLPLAVGCDVTTINVVFTPMQNPVNMLYDDDCDGDIDCAVTQPIIHHWINTGYLKIWGMVSSGHSQLGAPTMSIFQKYYGHGGLFPIGAWTPDCGLYKSASWNVAVVAQFDPGDICTNYRNCATVMRQAVASYVGDGGQTNGLVYVLTGPLSCEEDFRTSSPDIVSSLTGAQLEQRFIKEFVLMNSEVPTGFETNCARDPIACSEFFASVTSENGYPPVYVVPLNTGATDVITQVPIDDLPSTNPTKYAFRYVGRSSSTDEDALAVEFGVFGNTGWTVSSNSTNLVNSSTALNAWSAGNDSGQYYLTTAIDPALFENLLTPPWLPNSPL